MNFNEAVLIRDCISYWLKTPSYELEQYEIDDAKFILKKYEDMVEEDINISGAMDILLGGGNHEEKKLLKQIEAHILENQKCSLSDIQRTFNLNYPVAQKYIDEIKSGNCIIADGLTNDVIYRQRN